MTSVRLAPYVVMLATLASGPARAQTPPPKAMLTHTEGVVYLDDTLVGPDPSAGVVLGESSTLRTTDGRAVVALKRGGVLTLKDHTLVRVLANGVYNFNRIEVLQGTATVISDTSAPLVACRSNARLSSGGVFRFDVQPARADGTIGCRLAVFEGGAAVPLVSMTSVLRSGQSMTMDPACGDMIPTLAFAADQLDDFDRWSGQQATVRRQ
jgi:hypothetical protein